MTSFDTSNDNVKFQNICNLPNSLDVRVCFTDAKAVCVRLTVSILVSCSAITLDGNPRMLVASKSEGSGGDVTLLVGSVNEYITTDDSSDSQLV